MLFDEDPAAVRKQRHYILFPFASHRIARNAHISLYIL